MQSPETDGGPASEPKPPLQNPKSESEVVNQIKALEAEGNFRGEQQPSNPDLEAYERLKRRPKRPIVAGGLAHIRTQRLLRKGNDEIDDKG
jgi:hypothetical protein